MDQAPVLLVVGPPGSGAGGLGEVLSHHPQITLWRETDFIWDRHFRDAADDVRTAQDAFISVGQEVRDSFAGFARSTDAGMVMDNSFRNSLRIPYMHAVFPQAKFLFILRDGRDAVSALNRAWNAGAAAPAKGLGSRLGALRQSLQGQQNKRHKLNALRHQAGSWGDFLRGETLERTRWRGRFGWGPQIAGWERLLGRFTTLQFNAHQWLACVQAMAKHLPGLPRPQKLTIRLESLVADPSATLGSILRFLDMKPCPKCLERAQAMAHDPGEGWRRRFSREQLAEIGPIIDQALIKLGYDRDNRWWKQDEPAA